MIDSKLLKTRQKIKELPECFVIFIPERDVLGGGRLIYHIERRIEEENRLFNDGEHIIYVNCAYEDFSTELGKLVHEMLCSNADDMFFDELAEPARYLKNTKKGQNLTCRIMEELINEAVDEAVKRLSKE